MELLQKDGAHVGVRSVYGQRHGCHGDRVSENRNSGHKEFGRGEGGVKRGVPLERFPGTLRALVRGARTWAAERRKQQ